MAASVHRRSLLGMHQVGVVAQRWAVATAVILALGACSGQGSHAAAPLPSPTALPASSVRTGAPSPSLAPERTPEARPVLVNHGPRDRRVVALTFDADMTPSMLARLRSGEVTSWFNRRVVRELRVTGTPATFFLAGLWAQTYPAAVRSFARDPVFEIGNHSWDHPAFTPNCYGMEAVPEAGERGEVLRGAREIEKFSGEPPTYFRFPGGCHDDDDLRLVASLEEQPIGWDVVSGDAFEPDDAVVVGNVLGEVRPGSIVVMHLNGPPNAPATAAALHRLIPALEGRGFRFVSLSDLLG